MMIILNFIHKWYLSHHYYKNFKKFKKIITDNNYIIQIMGNNQLWIREKYYDPELSLLISDNYYHHTIIAIINIELLFTSNKDWLKLVIDDFDPDKPSISKTYFYYKSAKDIEILKQEQVLIDILKAEYRKSLITKILK